MSRYTMDIDITWYPPLPLKAGYADAPLYTVDGIEAWTDCPGVYMFCRQDGESLIPLYIGWSKNLSQRIREHLTTATLMRCLANGSQGDRVLMLGEYTPKAGQSAETALAMVEQTLMALAVAEGYTLLNTLGTNTPRHMVRFSG